jgi:hypothetical protein
MGEAQARRGAARPFVRAVVRALDRIGALERFQALPDGLGTDVQSGVSGSRPASASSWASPGWRLPGRP